MGTLPTVELLPGTRVIGDLHLELELEDDVQRFLRWLEGAARVPRLVILGDLFEYWIGPAQAESAGGRAVLGALAARTASGMAIDVIPGNRDFLLDRRFEALSGARVHPGGLIGRSADGSRVLFLHGDELATRDRDYQRLRRVLRSGPVRVCATRLPLGVSRSIARRLRRRSRRAVASKPAAEKALQPSACSEFAGRSRAQTLVCGHAHVFRDERLEDGVRWIVVDAFGGKRDTLELDDSFRFRVLLNGPEPRLS